MAAASEGGMFSVCGAGLKSSPVGLSTYLLYIQLII